MNRRTPASPACQKKAFSVVRAGRWRCGIEPRYWPAALAPDRLVIPLSRCVHPGERASEVGTAFLRHPFNQLCACRDVVDQTDDHPCCKHTTIHFHPFPRIATANYRHELTHILELSPARPAPNR